MESLSQFIQEDVLEGLRLLSEAGERRGEEGVAYLVLVSIFGAPEFHNHLHSSCRPYFLMLENTKDLISPVAASGLHAWCGVVLHATLSVAINATILRRPYPVLPQ